MNKLEKLIYASPTVGSVEWISYRPERKGKVLPIKEVMVHKETGIQGDHYGKSGKRQVTLIQKEHLEVVAKMLKKEQIDPKLTRRNIIVSGINLKSLIGKAFTIGDDLVLEATGDCVPCDRMEENLGPGGYQAMVNHGGICCKVVQSGYIKLGDEVKIHPAD